MKRSNENVDKVDEEKSIEENKNQSSENVELSQSREETTSLVVSPVSSENSNEETPTASNQETSSIGLMVSIPEGKPLLYLEEIDKTLEKLHELTEDVYLTTSLHSTNQINDFEKLFKSDKTNLRRCSLTLPTDLCKQTSEEDDDVLEEVEEAVRDAEEKQFEANHVALNIDTECSSDEERLEQGQKLNDSFRVYEDQEMFNIGGSGLSIKTTPARRTRHRISSNSNITDMVTFTAGPNHHERARSNDSRSTSLFSSSIASFRRPISHFSIDNSCFDLNETQHSLMCTPIEKMYVKNSRSAPEMRLHETNVNSFLSSPSSSNDATMLTTNTTTTTTTSEVEDLLPRTFDSNPSVSSEFLADHSIHPVVSNLRLRVNEGLLETEPTAAIPLVKAKKKSEKIMEMINLKMSASSPNMKAENAEVNIFHPKDAEKTETKIDDSIEEKRTIEVITIQVSNLQLQRKLKKSLYIMAKFDGNDVHRSPKIKPTGDSLVHEFAVETSEPFSKLHIVFLEGSKAKVARPVGKVSLSRKSIVANKNQTHNLKLCAVSKYPDFCGQICIDIRRRSGLFSIRVVDCGGLKLKENQTLSLLVSILGDNSEVGKLTIDAQNKRSREWLEMPCTDGMLSLKLTLWQDLLKGLNSVFHGQVRVDVDENWEAGPAKWFYLRSKQKASEEKNSENEEIGEVTVNTTHQIDHILRMQVYKPLLDILTASSKMVPLTATPISIIEALPKVELSQMSRSLVELLAQTDKIREVLNTLYVNSIYKCQDENTLFRGQSLAGKMLFEILTSYGKMYLITTLKPVIDKIFKERKNCEIDPSRILANSSLEKNKANVLVYFQILFQRVTQSSSNCPHFVKKLLFDLHSIVGKHTGRTDVQRLAVSSFVIMRFFAAAVLNPKAFEIRKDQPDLRVSRTLLLLSKMLQRVSNVTVSQGPLSSKESWLADVFEMVTSDHHKQDMTDFLDKISLARDVSEPEKSMVFKFGNLQQMDRSRVAWKKVIQYKKRYVQLTDSQLLWHKDVENAPKGFLQLVDIKAINVDNKHIITINTESSQFQFEAQGGVEANDWLMAIEKQRTRAVRGYDSEPLLFDVERHIDKIHTVLHKYRDTMTEWIDLLKSDEPLDENTAPEILRATFVPEADRKAHKETLIKTLSDTIEVTDSIQKVRDEYEEEHKKKQKLEEGAVESENQE